MAKGKRNKGGKIVYGSGAKPPDRGTKPKPPPMQQATQAAPGDRPPPRLKPPPADTGSSGTGSTGGGQPPTQGPKPPPAGDRKDRKKPTNPSLAAMSKYSKGKKGSKADRRQALMAVRKGVTAGAGVTGISSKASKAPKIEKDATTGKSVIPAGSVGYGGRSYTADNVEGLAREFNRKGLTLAQGLERNPYIAEGLKLDQKALNAYVGARKARSRTAKAMRQAKARRTIK
jgi:hypothetical protein